SKWQSCSSKPTPVTKRATTPCLPRAPLPLPPPPRQARRHPPTPGRARPARLERARKREHLHLAAAPAALRIDVQDAHRGLGLVGAEASEEPQGEPERDGHLVVTEGVLRKAAHDKAHEGRPRPGRRRPRLGIAGARLGPPAEPQAR